MNEKEDTTTPSAAVCEKRCQEFAEVTGTDTALAMFYLQDRDWNLDRAVNSYFEEGGAMGGAGLDTNSNSAGSAGASQSSSTSNSSGADSQMGGRIRLLSWNIDGLDKQNLVSRTDAICDTINRESPHVVFLQEVVEGSEGILQDRCPMYHMVPANDELYYTAIMLKIGDTTVEESKILPYPSSLMGRNLLTVKCKIRGEKFYLATSHLESTKDHGKERKNQLKKAFGHIGSVDPDRTVVFGGDLNLRDKELDEIGGIPHGIVDIWEVTGKRPEAKFTWDMQRNDNLEWSQKFKPRSRFDRLYMRYSNKKDIVPVYFELTGLERLKSCQRFPSDHWGLLAHFNITSKMT